MSAVKLRRNDPCWCGSGKKYKKCHIERESAKPVPLAAVRNAAECVWDEKRCLHPFASARTCDKVVSAHTVQRSGVLQRIIDVSNHVQTFYRATSGEPRTVGWRIASTFTGFCARHDSTTFRPLETAPFVGTEEQCFLVGYRALCYEVYQKRASLRASPVIRDLADRGHPVEVQQRVQRIYSVMNAGAYKGLAAFEALKGSMDRQLLENRYAGWSRLVVRFRGELCVASTGAVSPNRDLDGRELQALHDPDATRQETLLYGVVATAEGGAVVLIWPQHHTAPRQLLESVLKRGAETLGGLLVQFMFAYVENTYFSAKWWQSLTLPERQHIAALAQMANAYYTDFSYLMSRLVPWEIVQATIGETA